jgi:hypothetical protein
MQRSIKRHCVPHAHELPLPLLLLLLPLLPAMLLPAHMLLPHQHSRLQKPLLYLL